MDEKNKKPLVIYLHRYAMEYESYQFPTSRRLLDILLKKNRVIYFSMGTKEEINQKVRQGLEIHELPLKVSNKNGIDKGIKTIAYYFFLPYTLIKIKKLNPDFIICKETLPFIPFFVRLLNIPMLIDTSDWWFSILLGKRNFGKKLASILEKLEVRGWNSPKVTVVAHSKAEAEMSEKKGFRHEIKVINAPMYGNIFRPYNAKKQRKLLKFKDSDFVLAVHGIIHPSKGYDRLLEWWKKLSLEHKNWKLLIIGGSFGENWCRNEIKRLNLENNAIMTGWLKTQEDLNQYLNAANCLLVIRRNTPENQGVIPSALYHSLPTGKPTLATGLPGFSEIIQHNVNGFLYTPDDYNSFKTVLEFISSNPKQAKKVGINGIKRAKECFDPEKTAQDYVKIAENSINYS